MRNGGGGKWGAHVKILSGSLAHPLLSGLLFPLSILAPGPMGCPLDMDVDVLKEDTRGISSWRKAVLAVLGGEPGDRGMTRVKSILLLSRRAVEREATSLAFGGSLGTRRTFGSSRGP